MYNSRGYVDRFFEMILAQSFKDWELICVDDSSADESYERATYYARNDRRISVLKTFENSGGPFIPRSLGIERATSSLICLLDIDDLIDKHYLGSMVQRIIESRSHIVFPNMMEENRIVTKIDQTQSYVGHELIQHTLFSWNIGCNGGIYGRDLLRHIYLQEVPVFLSDYWNLPLRAPEIKWERWGWFDKSTSCFYPCFIDEVATRFLLFQAGKVSFCSNAVYHRCDNVDSITDRNHVRSLSFLLNYYLLVIWASKLPCTFSSTSQIVAGAHRQFFYGVIEKMKQLKAWKNILPQDSYREVERLLRFMFERLDREAIRPHLGVPLYILSSFGFDGCQRFLWLHGKKGWRTHKKTVSAI